MNWQRIETAWIIGFLGALLIGSLAFMRINEQEIASAPIVDSRVALAVHHAGHVVEPLPQWVRPPTERDADGLLDLWKAQSLRNSKFGYWRVPSEFQWALDREDRPIVLTRSLNELTHTLRRRENLARIRQLYRVSESQLRAWNPDVSLAQLSVGDEVVVWRRAPGTYGRSAGLAHHGRLYMGEPLPDSDNYEIIHRHRVFGTYYTISETVRVLDDYYLTYPDAEPLMIGDISFRTGGSIAPHKSHQAGRDVDITLPRKRPPPNYRRFHRITRSNLDVERALWLLKAFIDGGQVEYIFVDRYIQRRLYHLAKEEGAPGEWLDAVFQYPGHAGGDAIVRHSRGHRNHFHVRFRCQPTDVRCR